MTATTATIVRNEAAIGLELVSPTGSEIRGTWELVPGVAESSTINANGEPAYYGNTDVIWDEQKTIACSETNDQLWIDVDGELWRESQLRALAGNKNEEGDEESIPLFLPEDPLRNGPDAKPHQDKEVYGGLILVNHDEYRAMKKRLAELSSGVFVVIS